MILYPRGDERDMDPGDINAIEVVVPIYIFCCLLALGMAVTARIKPRWNSIDDMCVRTLYLVGWCVLAILWPLLLLGLFAKWFFGGANRCCGVDWSKLGKIWRKSETNRRRDEQQDHLERGGKIDKQPGSHEDMELPPYPGSV
ncbi:hypothetical protein QBC40DRAFT_255936 [Triangularia verruculosa]|uniref:Uncharacterized protein n=1 Tax=Triangularia verruculosa TaxID=2587418 RepID=A0AAN7ARK3_9PEZI|nr:hypothetical protein QBC40DRAFT_255936 [Triangularia verruculosa]